MVDAVDPVRVSQAIARPGYGEELYALGVRDLTGFGPPEFGWPPWNEARIRQVVDEALATERPARRRKRRAGPGRSNGEVLVVEANKAARIYMRDPTMTRYAVWGPLQPGAGQSG